MNLTKIIVTIIGILGISATYWFFLKKKKVRPVAVAGGAVEIVVDGGYSPSAISIPVGKPATITFFRKDPSTCLEEVVLADFKIRQYLPLNKKVSVTITPKQSGEFPFACGMNMFHGKILVE